MIVNGKKGWLMLLEDIWKEAFGDEEEFIRSFHYHFFQESQTWCYVEKEEPVAVIYGIPALLWGENGSTRRIVYLYGGATRKACRGRGYYKALMKWITERKETLGLPILVPGAGLIPYYESCGFQVLLREEKNCYEDGQEQGIEPLLLGRDEMEIEAVTLEADRYQRIRDKRLGKAGYIQWDLNYLEYAIHGVLGEGGMARGIWVKGEEQLFLGVRKGNSLKVIETTLSSTEIEKYAHQILKFFSCERLCTGGTVLMGSGWDKELSPYFGIGMEE